MAKSCTFSTNVIFVHKRNKHARYTIPRLTVGRNPQRKPCILTPTDCLCFDLHHQSTIVVETILTGNRLRLGNSLNFYESHLTDTLVVLSLFVPCGALKLKCCFDLSCLFSYCCACIMKTGLFKYIENFTSKNGKKFT